MATCTPEVSEDARKVKLNVRPSDSFHESESDSDSEELAELKTFSLNYDDMDKCLRILHTDKLPKANKSLHKRCQTSTSTCRWSRETSKACAAYKILKVKPWLLTDVNLVFDPLNKDQRIKKVQASQLLWTEKCISTDAGVSNVSVNAAGVSDASVSDASVSDAGESTDGSACSFAIKTLSVDGMLSKITKFDHLKKLDEVMKEIDEDFDLSTMGKKAKMLPPAVQMPLMTFIYTLKHAVTILKTGGRVPQAVFQTIFEKLVNCVVICIGAEQLIDCSPVMDGMELDKLKLHTYLKDVKKKDIIISSKPDLYFYQRVPSSKRRRIIAVVEVKGKAGERIIHSDDEDEDEEAASSAATLGILDEESEEESDEELPSLEKIKTPKHSHMKKFTSESRRYTRKFLPQLIGEMLCCRGTKGLQGIMRDSPDSTFGIAVIGFDVYFVTMVIAGLGEELMSGPGHGLNELVNDPGIYTNVFITQPFNLCNRSDRRTVLKVLAAGCFVDEDYILDELAKLK